MRGVKLRLIVTLAVLGVGVSGVAVIAVTSPLAATAQPTTDVRLTPDSGAINVSENTTFDIVLTDATGGVGAFDISVQLTDTSVARIESASLHGGRVANTSNVTIATSRDGVQLQAALLDTNDSGPVSVASVTVSGEQVGHTNLSMQVTAVSNESGQSYSVAAEQGASLEVTTPPGPSTALSLSADRTTLSSEQTATISLAVDSASDGVGAFAANLSISDPNVAEIIEAEVVANGSVGTRTADIASGKGSASFRAAVLDTPDTGSVALVNVTLQPKVRGTTTVTAAVSGLYTEPGARYEISSVSNTTISVDLPSTPTVSMGDASMPPNASSTAELRLSHAPAGLAGYRINVTVVNDSVASITGGSVPSQFALNDSTVTSHNSSITLTASDLNDEVAPGATSITLATVSFEGETVGSSDLMIEVIQIDDDTGSALGVNVTGGSVSVGTKPVVCPGCGVPTDPDDDGQFEDLNGNNKFDFNDIVVLFEQLFDSAVTEHAVAYDFNENGRIDFDDVVTLFEEI